MSRGASRTEIPIYSLPVGCKTACNTKSLEAVTGLCHSGCTPHAQQCTSNSSDTATPTMPDPGWLELHMPASKLSDRTRTISRIPEIHSAWPSPCWLHSNGIKLRRALTDKELRRRCKS